MTNKNRAFRVYDGNPVYDENGNELGLESGAREMHHFDTYEKALKCAKQMSKRSDKQFVYIFDNVKRTRIEVIKVEH